MKRAALLEAGDGTLSAEIAWYRISPKLAGHGCTGEISGSLCSHTWFVGFGARCYRRIGPGGL